MHIVTNTNDLAKVCEDLAKEEFVTVDTEFLRESTFWPELCLIQMASPNKDQDDAYIIDPLADGIDLAPFFELMGNENVVKVFHAARQDVEIIYKLGNLIPHPIFDTQIAAMVCGYGDSISYDQLVNKIVGVSIDKSSRFTDWKRRPLSQKQLDYAAADVTHLRKVYLAIKANLHEQGRAEWVSEEMDILTSPSTYEMLPENAWKRLKMRVRKPIGLAIMKEIARWREQTAQDKNVPRGRVIKDDAIYEIAGNPPKSISDLGKYRGLARGFDKSRHGDALMAIIEKTYKIPKDNLPKIPKPKQLPEGCSAASEMIKLLLKLVADKHGVAPKILANADDIEKIASDDNADVRALKGWRYKFFGEKALKLKHGKLAIGYSDRKIQLIDLEEHAKAEAAE